MQIERTFRVERRGKRPVIRSGDEAPPPELPPGRVPRVSRLLALAIRFEGLIRDGVVEDYATLARLGHVTRARLTQVMNLLLLAPAIQEELLFLPLTKQGRDPIRLMQLQPIALTPLWGKQWALWKALLGSSSQPESSPHGTRRN